jgi:valyl-tRNA synthetase
MQDLVRAVREVRNRYMIDLKTNLDVFVHCGSAVAADFRALTVFVTALAGVGRLEVGTDVVKPPQSATHIHPDFEAYVSLRGLIDREKEIQRAEKQRADVQKRLQSARAKLENANFVKNAPAEVVEQQQAQVAELEKQIKAIEETLRDLRQG